MPKFEVQACREYFAFGHAVVEARDANEAAELARETVEDFGGMQWDGITIIQNVREVES